MNYIYPVNPLINDLIEIVDDYKDMKLDTNHVSKWLNQFPEVHHEIILNELISILKTSYCSKKQFSNFLSESLNNSSIFPDGFKNHKFINPQSTGNSQSYILELLDEIMNQNHNISISECGSNYPSSYVYIDDAFYSGRRVLNDMSDWKDSLISLEKINQINLIFYALHDRDVCYIKKEIKKLFPNASIKFYSKIEFQNSLNNRNTNLEAFSLTNGIEYSEDTTSYIDTIVAKRSQSQNQHYPILRNTNTPSKDSYFTSSDNRRLVEQLFFEKGLEIITYAANPNPYMRPFGYDRTYTLGFGSYFINFRNIANNCPLVLWWGNPEAFYGVNNWYPLFPRTVNENSNNGNIV